jgi:hypothetical protein
MYSYCISDIHSNICYYSITSQAKALTRCPREFPEKQTTVEEPFGCSTRGDFKREREMATQVGCAEY